MGDLTFSMKIRNLLSQVILHAAILFFITYITCAVLAYAVGESYAIGPNLEVFYVAHKWISWLFANWSKLSWSAYSYLKVKLVAIIVFIPAILLFVYSLFFKKLCSLKVFKAEEKVHGDAHWGDDSDVKRAGLRAKEGMLVGKDSGGYLVADGFQHALLFAPTGSGKGVGFAIPNMLFWHHSLVVHDIKLENYQLGSGWREKQGHKVFVWEPSNPDGITHCYNPIDWVSSKPGQMVDDVQKIANLVIPEKDFWNNEARSLFLGVCLYLIADPSKPKSFGEIVRTMRSDDVAYNLAVVLDTLGKAIHPVAYMNIAAFLQKADKERSGVISTTNSGLELWANPLIDTATASSDFNVLEFKKIKTTVFVGLTPDNINRLQKLMQVFYQQATEFLSRKMPNIEEEPYGVLFMMDEFPTLGKMEQFKTGIAYFRGYRVRLFLIIQDTQQLKGIYEEAGMNSFLSNSTYRITFAANNYETANLISQLCGNKTVTQTSHSKPKFFDLNPSTRTVNVSEVQRALLLPQEVIQLSRDEQIILIESFPPIKSKKIKYYEDKFFTSRLLPPTFVPTQKPYELPTEGAGDEEETGVDTIDDSDDEPNDTDNEYNINENDEIDDSDDEADEHDQDETDVEDTDEADEYDEDETDVEDTDEADEHDEDETDVEDTDEADEHDEDETDVEDTDEADEHDEDETDVEDTDEADEYDEDETDVEDTDEADEHDQDETDSKKLQKGKKNNEESKNTKDTNITDEEKSNKKSKKIDQE